MARAQNCRSVAGINGTLSSMTVTREDRRREREERVVAVLGERQAARALDLLELVELAWHDCYGDVTPPEEIIDDMLLLSDGSIEGLIVAARLGVTDWRDLKVAADARPGPAITADLAPRRSALTLG